jgi:hypothetical protein
MIDDYQDWTVALALVCVKLGAYSVFALAKAVS